MDFFLRICRNHWGLGIFTLDVLAALATLFRRVTGHYINFTEPAHFLWRGQDPYGVVFDGSPGAFFYSPGCALYFYGLFAFLPPLLGQFLYMALSLALFVWGLHSLLTALLAAIGFDFKHSYYRNLIWLMLASEVLGGIQAVKIDVLIVGAILACVACLIRGHRVYFALFLLGILTSWKLHPLSMFGLLLLPYVFDREWKPPAAYFSGFAAGFLSPVVVLSPAFSLRLTEHWLGTLQEFTADMWLAPIFQHLYGFLFRAFGWPMDLGATSKITALVGLGFAVAVVACYARWKKSFGQRQARTLAWLTALGLGSAFTAMFSQLIQSNSYVVYTPLPLVLVVFATRRNWNFAWTTTLLVACFFVISLAYSDLNPRPLYYVLYAWGIKPLGVLALTLVFLWGVLWEEEK